MSQVMLVYPPITDSTSPYHSLVYLASYARSAGFADIEIRDTNIEALNYCARPDVLADLTGQWQVRRRQLRSKASLSGPEQLEYLQLARAESVDAKGVAAAIAVLRDPVQFYDYRAYRAAAEQVSHWLESLSCSGLPSQFETGGHELRRRGQFSLSSVADLTNELLLDHVVGPFADYYRNVFFPDLVRKAPRVVGINVTYTSQLPYALWLVRRIRRLLPETFIVCGGTEVGALWKYLIDRHRMADLFEGADACVVGEGETAFVRLLESVLAGRTPGPIQNVVTLDRNRRVVDLPPGIHYEELESLPTPEFGLMDSSPYFSPHPLVYYSPTRGCYWNKCTFCDYGLNTGKPTSPWRQASVDKCIEDLRRISEHSRHVYLSVDVLAPGRLLQLANAVVDAGIDLRWSAEIRLERYFNLERCQVLRRSGCVAVSVGFESGSQRILELIDKGVALPDVENTIRNFSTAEVAVQMMGFTGFPSETHEEAMASVEFLARNRRWWTVSALGTFMLTPGAIVAKKPTPSGMERLGAYKNDDIARTLNFGSVAETPGNPGEIEALRQAKRSLVRAEFDRPFAGGIDSAHSIFYYSRFGRRFPEDFVPARSGTRWRFDPRAVLQVNGKLIREEPFDLLRVDAPALLESAHYDAGMAGVALDHAAVLKRLNAAQPLLRGESMRHFVARSDGAIVPCPAPVAQLLGLVDGLRPVAQIEADAAGLLAAWPSAELLAYAGALDFVAHGCQQLRPRGKKSARNTSSTFSTLICALVDAKILVEPAVPAAGTILAEPALEVAALDASPEGAIPQSGT